MRCPFCHKPDDKVVDSRESRDGNSVRRRRECTSCKRRYTTYERVESAMPMLVKKDGRREPWDRMKLLAGLRRACEKRPISADALDDSVAQIELELQRNEGREMPSALVGEAVMRRLRDLDHVAYVRFASVYKSFRDADEFIDVVAKLATGEPGPGSDE